MKGLRIIAVWIGITVFVVTTGIVAISLYMVRGWLSDFGILILVCLSICFITLPIGIVLLLIRLFFMAEKLDIGPTGAYLRWFGKVTPLKPLSLDTTVVDSVDSSLQVTSLVTPTEPSRNYLGYEKIYQTLLNAGINLEEMEDEQEPERIEPPRLQIVGGGSSEENDLLAQALEGYSRGNKGRNTLAKYLDVSPHRAAQLLVILKARGLANDSGPKDE